MSPIHSHKLPGRIDSSGGASKFERIKANSTLWPRRERCSYPPAGLARKNPGWGCHPSNRSAILTSFLKRVGMASAGCQKCGRKVQGVLTHDPSPLMTTDSPNVALLFVEIIARFWVKIPPSINETAKRKEDNHWYDRSLISFRTGVSTIRINYK